MSTNSIRVSSDLFARAQHQAELMSRSIAQQVEHWARLGAALEASGLAVTGLANLLKADDAKAATHTEAAPAEDLWKFKRERQRADIARVKSGATSTEQMNWFSGGRARKAKLVNSPF